MKNPMSNIAFGMAAPALSNRNIRDVISNALGPVPEIDVMAKRHQGLLNVGDSFRADGGAAFLRS
jgi:hypothetical protein